MTDNTTATTAATMPTTKPTTTEVKEVTVKVWDNTKVVVDIKLPDLSGHALVGICIVPSKITADPCIELVFIFPRLNPIGIKVKEGVKKFLKANMLSDNELQLVFDPFNVSYAGKLRCYENGDKLSDAGKIDNCAGQTLVAMGKYILFNCEPFYSIQITMDIIVN